MAKLVYKYSEREMVIEFCKVLQQKNLLFAVEVPFMNRSVDLVFYKRGKVVAIEFKLNNWKRALQQAKVHLLGADEVYVCLPKKTYCGKTQKMESLFKENNCGLVLFDFDEKEMEFVFTPSGHQKWEGGIAIMKKGVDYSVENNNYRMLLGEGV